MLRWVEISHCVWRMHSEGTGLVGRVVKDPFSKKNYFFSWVEIKMFWPECPRWPFPADAGCRVIKGPFSKKNYFF